jgi:cell division GTPase FtsZ
MSKVNVYAIGGCGISIVSQLENEDMYSGQNGVHAPTTFYYIDTSYSNLKKMNIDDRIHVIDDLDGSGKKRDENYKIISEHIKSILMKFPPADLNIVVHSGGGGKYCPL